MPEGFEKVFLSGDVDVVLPTPLFVSPSLRGNYCERHETKPWNVMMDVLRELYPSCVSEAEAFFADNGAYSPCNMLIARKSVFDDMCEWLFPILFKVIDKCGTIEDTYQNRYPGFMAERLISFYYYWKKDVKVCYADKVFLG